MVLIAACLHLHSIQADEGNIGYAFTREEWLDKNHNNDNVYDTTQCLSPDQINFTVPPVHPEKSKRIDYKLARSFTGQTYAAFMTIGKRTELGQAIIEIENRPRGWRDVTFDVRACVPMEIRDRKEEKDNYVTKPDDNKKSYMPAVNSMWIVRDKTVKGVPGDILLWMFHGARVRGRAV